MSRPGRLAVETALAEIEVVAHLALESGTAQRALSASITRHAGVETRHNFHLVLEARPIALRDNWLGSPPRLNVDNCMYYSPCIGKSTVISLPFGQRDVTTPTEWWLTEPHLYLGVDTHPFTLTRSPTFKANEEFPPTPPVQMKIYMR